MKDYTLTIEYSFAKHGYDLETKVAKLLRRPSDGSGLELRTWKRDAEWVWFRRTYRDRAVKRLRAMKIKGLKITTSDYDPGKGP